MEAGPTDWKCGGFNKPSSQEAHWIYTTWLHFLLWCWCLPNIAVTTHLPGDTLPGLLSEPICDKGTAYPTWDGFLKVTLIPFTFTSFADSWLKVFSYFYRNNLNLIAKSSISFPWISPSVIPAPSKLLGRWYTAALFPSSGTTSSSFLSCFVLGFLSFSFKGTRLSLYWGSLLPMWLKKKRHLSLWMLTKAQMLPNISNGRKASYSKVRFVEQSFVPQT